MIGDIRVLLEMIPFEPFSVVTSEGKEYFVATSDHADISPTGNRFIIWFDDESSVTIAGLHITSIVKNPSPAESNP